MQLPSSALTLQHESNPALHLFHYIRITLHRVCIYLHSRGGYQYQGQILGVIEVMTPKSPKILTYTYKSQNLERPLGLLDPVLSGYMTVMCVFQSLRWVVYVRRAQCLSSLALKESTDGSSTTVDGSVFQS